MLSQYEAHDLKHNQLFNKYGSIEGNVPLDLRMEKCIKLLNVSGRHWALT